MQCLLKASTALPETVPEVVPETAPRDRVPRPPPSLLVQPDKRAQALAALRGHLICAGNKVHLREANVWRSERRRLAPPAGRRRPCRLAASLSSILF